MDKTVSRFVREKLWPRLEDHEWLLGPARSLVKIRNNLLMGLDFDRTSSGRGERTVVVFLRPLYWPRPSGYYGLSRRISAWTGRGDTFELSVERQSADSAARIIAEAVNGRIAPMFRALVDERRMLRYGRAHPWDPLVGWFERTFSGDAAESVIGYAAAWAGERLTAEWNLRRELKYIARDADSEQTAYADHVRKTLGLLGKRQQLQTFLEATAEGMRAELRLDSCRVVEETVCPPLAR